MTTFATIDPILRELFERLDFFPQPKDESLSRLLKYWMQKRAGHVAPKLQEIHSSELGDDGANAFVLQLGPHETEPHVIFSGATFDALRAESSQQNGAARLRRLVELVRQRAEPTLAEFAAGAKDAEKLHAEILLAPLSQNGQVIDGFFGGVALRRIPAAPSASIRTFRAPLNEQEPFLFALKSATDLGERIARHLGQTLQNHEEREFEDGEHKIRPLVDVRGRHVHVIASLHGDAGQSVNDRLCRLLFFIGALKDAGAASLTVIAPYLCYARKDRQTKIYDPVTIRYVGQIFEAVGTDRLITMEVHNLAAFQNAFRCNTTHLNAYEVFSQHIIGLVGERPLTVVAPDNGGAKRAEIFREWLETRIGRPIAKALADKQRSMGHVSGDLFAGDVSGRVAIILDDLISTGTTMARVAWQCRKFGASQVIVAATHGVGGVSSLANLTDPAIDKVILANTIPQTPDFLSGMGDRLAILDVSEIFARALQ